MSATRRRTRARRKAMERGRFAEFMLLSRPALERLARDIVGVPDVSDARWVDGVLHVTLTTRTVDVERVREAMMGCVKNDT